MTTGKKIVLGLLALIVLVLAVRTLNASRPSRTLAQDTQDAAIRRNCEQITRDGKGDMDACVQSLKTTGVYSNLTLTPPASRAKSKGQ